MANEMPGLQFDRLKRAIASFVRELLPALDYMKPHLYVVTAWDDDAQAANLDPSAATSGMPSLAKVAWRGLGKVTLPVGIEVVVWFDNGSPTRPFIGIAGQSSSAGSQAGEIELSSSDVTLTAPLNHGRVVRYGDPVLVYPGGVATPGTIESPPLAPGSFSRVKA